VTARLLLDYVDARVAIVGEGDWASWVPRLSPFVLFQPEMDGQDPQATVTLVEDPEPFQRALESKDAPLVPLHGDHVAHRLVLAGREVFVLENVAFSCARGTPPVVTVYWSRDRKAAEFEVMRIARGLLTGLAERAGWRRVHMAAVALGRRVVGICGPKGAGKTSALLSLLLLSPELSLLTNDKALVRSDAAGMAVVGVPYAVSVGDGALNCVSPLKGAPSIRNLDGKTHYWPSSVASALNCGLQGGGLLTGLLALDLALQDGEGPAASLSRGAMPAAALQAVSSFSEKMHPRWIFPRLGLDIPSHPPLSFADLPQAQFRGNPWGNLELLEMVQEMLEAA
jgi:hypothetical protein